MDCNDEELTLMKRKRARVLKLRQEYIKQITNPHRHKTGEGGAIFDSGIQRFIAMRANSYDFFKANKKTVKVGALSVVIPIVLFAWAIHSERSGREELYKTGQVAYKDRQFKFI